MIAKQRHWHLRIWFTLTLLLPIAFVLSWSVIPENTVKVPDSIEIQAETKVIKDSILAIVVSKTSIHDSPGYLVLIGQSEDSHPEHCYWIGRVSAAGKYEFPLPEGHDGNGYVFLYNPFSKKVVLTTKI
ncbi:MAG: hypothetical protein DHS20C17_26250 [Cyclobacteriaceae bacterium]|nr:MAG: hypothetical protein DHS20C17_26250 [Cyclobacteriaceae bacterium]